MILSIFSYLFAISVSTFEKSVQTMWSLLVVLLVLFCFWVLYIFCMLTLMKSWHIFSPTLYIGCLLTLLFPLLYSFFIWRNTLIFVFVSWAIGVLFRKFFSVPIIMISYSSFKVSDFLLKYLKYFELIFVERNMV